MLPAVHCWTIRRFAPASATAGRRIAAPLRLTKKKYRRQRKHRSKNNFPISTSTSGLRLPPYSGERGWG